MMKRLCQQLLAISVLLLFCHFLTGQPGGSPGPFTEVVRSQFGNWDLYHEGVLSPRAIEILIARPTIRGQEAAALAAIHQIQERKNQPLPPLTLDWFSQAASNKDKELHSFLTLYHQNWRHISQARHQLFSEDAPNLKGFHQGRLGDCYLLSALGAAVQRNPAGVRRMFGWHPDRSCDIRFPSGAIVHVPPVTDAEIALGGSANEQGLWLNYLEKGYGLLKVRSQPRNLQNSNVLDAIGRGGDARTTIHILTGHEAEFLSLHHDQVRTERERRELANKVNALLCAATDTKRLACCSTGKGKVPPGIIKNHDYAVLGYMKQKHLVEVWNPWGNSFRPACKDGLETGYLTEGGMFAIPLDEFVQVFSGLFVETTKYRP